jgi:hypothetical protein
LTAARPGLGARPAAARRLSVEPAREERAEEVAEAGEILGIAAVFEADATRRAATETAEAGERIAAAPCGAASLLIGPPVAAQLVVELALLGIGEDLVGLVDLLEAALSRGIALIRIGWCCRASLRKAFLMSA